MLPAIHVKLRKDKPKDDKFPIIIQVYFNKKQKQIFTGLYVEEKHFKDGEVLKTYLQHTFYNQVIKKKIAELEAGYLKQLLSNDAITLATEPKKQTRTNFFEYAYEMYNGMKNRNSAIYIKRSVSALEAFEKFAGSITFQAITPDLLKRYEDYLFSTGLQRNTINRIYKRIKQVFTQAVKDGTTKENPFNFYKPITYKQTKRDYITMDEMKLVENVQLPAEIEHIRNYFLLSCYTGLRFSDLKNFDANKAITKNNGVERIIIGTTKTGEIVSIKLSKKVKEVIKKIDKPLPTNVHANRILKIIAEKAKIGRPINWHQSRHGFAVNSAALGIPIEAVSRLLGHQNIRTTAIYYKVTDTKIDEFMDRWSEI
jgi:site-specific recombinase XerD